jgi:hypothetical protein
VFIAREEACLLLSRGTEEDGKGSSTNFRPEGFYNTRKETQKSQIKYPFEIRYSLIGRVARDKIPDICHETKITHTNFEHTCELSTTYLREAKQLGGRVKLDIPALKTALDLLRLHPNTEACMLRPYLVRALPNWHQ